MSKDTVKPRNWECRRQTYFERLAASRHFVCSENSKIVDPTHVVALLEAVIRSGDRVALEGNNQKQADFLAAALSDVNPAKVNRLHMVQSVIALPEHSAIFEKGIAEKLDFSYSGPQSVQMARLVDEKKLQIGEIHTYLELFGRYFIDLSPRVALVTGISADPQGNIFSGPNTEDTPVIVEATHFRHGIVIVQVEKILDSLPRKDIPGDWVDFIIPVGRPCHIEPLFTRDPAKIRPAQILMAMMVIKGIYSEYGVHSLNHGIGYATAAIELLLPTFADKLNQKGKICTHWALNPHPTLIPAIESGFVDAIHSFGSEVGTEDYVAARSDIFPVGPDGFLRSNRAFAQAAGHYAVDAFVGSTLQIDRYGNSSTAMRGRIAGFGGAPNMGCDAPGRRHSSDAWLRTGQETATAPTLTGNLPRGRKIVVQMLETKGFGGSECFVNRLDAWDLKMSAALKIPPVMIYGDAITQIVSEKGIAHLHKCASIEEREAAIRAIAGGTEVGKKADHAETLLLRKRRIVQSPEDLGILPSSANRSLLAAKNMEDLVKWSGGLYRIPPQFQKAEPKQPTSQKLKSGKK